MVRLAELAPDVFALQTHSKCALERGSSVWRIDRNHRLAGDERHILNLDQGHRAPLVGYLIQEQ